MPTKSKLCLGYSPHGNGHHIFPFDAVFERSINIMSGLDQADCVVFWGGTDIYTQLYKQPTGKYTQSFTLTDRDKFEWKAMVYCKANNIPMIGVCRGAQLMCAFAGGSLVQHVTGHRNIEHHITTVDGEVMSAPSDHHQMMYPWNVRHELLAWSTTKRSDTYLNGNNQELVELNSAKYAEPEVVYFPNINGLAIQPHPEWAKKDTRFPDYCNELVRDRLLAVTFA